MIKRIVIVELMLVSAVLSLVGCSRSQTKLGFIDEAVPHLQLAYAVSLGMESEIWVTDLSEKACVAHVEGGTRSLEWSPDRRYLAWVAYDYQTHRSSLWMMSAEEMPILVVAWTENLLTYWWSPDGKTLLVLEVDPEDGTNTSVYGLSVETRQRASVWFESLPFHRFVDFAISPNWQYVACLESGTSTLVVHDRDGGRWSIFDLPSGAHGFASLMWSQDSQWLAFSAANDDYTQIDIHVSCPNGEELRQLTAAVGLRGVLGWSPSSHYLAYNLSDPSNGNQLCYTDINTTSMTSRCIERVWAGGRMHWISDREWVLTTNRIDGQWDIYGVSLTDEVFTNLTQDDRVESRLALGLLD